MNLVQLSNNETKLLEENTIPIENMYYNAKRKNILYNTIQSEKQYLKKQMELNSWIHTHNMDANTSIKTRKNKLTSLLGFEANYQKRYEYLTLVWGLEWNNEKFIIYYSQKGLYIQVKENFNINLLNSFYDELIDSLVDKTSGFYTKYFK